MEIKRAELGQIDEIMSVFDNARGIMRANGNNQQWINGYPQRELICEDIESGCCFVCVCSTGICGVFSFIIGEDSTYSYIEDGRWLNNEPYGTLHRLGSSGAVKGVARACLDYCKSQVKNVRADTHADNAAMQAVLLKNGFKKCGIIYVEDGTPRTAFQFDGGEK